MSGQGLERETSGQHDILERKQVEGELLRYREHLEKLAAERTAQLAEANAALRNEVAERRQVEEALRRSEERYALAQRAANIGSWDWDVRSGDLHWSDQIEPMFGFGCGEFGATYEAFLECIHPEDRQRVMDAVDASVEKGVAYAIEHRIVWPDGSVRWVSEVGDVVRDEHGRAIRMLGIVQDVTDRKQAERALRASQRFLQSTLDSLPDHIAILDQEGTILEVNAPWRRFARENGLAWSDHGVGRNYLAVVESASGDLAGGAKETAQGIREVIAGQRDWFSSEYPCHSPQKRRWFVMRVTRFESGEGVRVVTLHEDITERKLAEETRARLAAIVESSDDAIIGKSLDGTILSWNDGAERMYGYTAEEAVGQPISVLIPPDRPDEVVQLLERIRQGERIALFETVRVKKGGEQIHISLNISPILDPSGKVIGASTIARDITARRQAELSLHQAKEEAEAARQEEEQRRQEAERRRRIAESLGDVLAVLNSNRALDEVLSYITVQAGRLLSARAAGIYSLERETGRFSVKATRGLLVTYVAGVRIPIGQDALHRAITSRRPVPVPDLAATLAGSQARAPRAESREAAAVWAKVYRALLAVPIVVQDEVYGGMLLYYGEPRVFSEEEIDLAVAFGDQVALAIGNARLRDQVEQSAKSAERDRLARELHDAVTQTLFSASLIAEAMPRVWEQDAEAGRRGLEELRRLTRGAAAEMRTMLVELRPAALTEKPLGELLRHLTEAMTARIRVPIDLTVDGNCVLPPDVQIALYRIVQESLNNVAKHARASHVAVDLRCQPQWAALGIGDNGDGFDPDDVLPDRFGLSIMRERAEGIGAILEVESHPGKGTRISVNWHA
jgi:PAS domain S-box-containing protein